ncbi:acyltransferase domain-containing protein [Brevibacillus dissolubilis]|uniref:acyltransferase domain-containing protein n=1 Tax=Brevibacillus dissolubilis TaxID=1844116 RepID=UPI0011178590|nr:acyltransferase domain-containing protein [Brevibacillus dissolubilis]
MSSSNPIIFMFAGQGSQYFHMGKELLKNNPVFHRWMYGLDRMIQQRLGESLIDRIYDQEKRLTDSFDRTLYTHPAIFMVEIALAQTLIEEGIRPDYVLGSSLGEFAALVIAGVLTLEEGLDAVITHARVLEANCASGTMTAILHDPSLYRENPLLYRNSEIAAINFESHFVIAGQTEKLREIEAYLKENRITHQALAITQGFHSAVIDPAAPLYRDYLSRLTFRTPQIPVVSGLYGQIIQAVPGQYLWDVARQPMEFPKSIRSVESRGGGTYIDISPSGTLATFAKYHIDPNQSTIFPIMTMFHQDVKNLEKIRAALQQA